LGAEKMLIHALHQSIKHITGSMAAWLIISA
jgi:hypothetical protein